MLKVVYWYLGTWSLPESRFMRLLLLLRMFLFMLILRRLWSGTARRTGQRMAQTPFFLILLLLLLLLFPVFGAFRLGFGFEGEAFRQVALRS